MSSSVTHSESRPSRSTELVFDRDGGLWRAGFTAMACPCEVLIETEDIGAARRAAEAVAAEAWRIESKFSRYRIDNLVHAINTAMGRPVTVDEETARLLDFAADCYRLSEGLFDITSGVLRRVWRFDGSDRLPDAEAVRQVLKYVGWDRVSWHAPSLRMPPGMEIDFGGIGKEYAVDRAASLGSEVSGEAPLLVNFGGDINATRPRAGGKPWQVAIERIGENQAPPVVALYHGGITTSGDARRFLLKDGIRYGHILDPRTGWPVHDAPRSVTVLERNCTQAGLISTLAILQGRHAEKFLRKQNVKHWIMR